MSLTEAKRDILPALTQLNQLVVEYTVKRLQNLVFACCRRFDIDGRVYHLEMRPIWIFNRMDPTKSKSREASRDMSPSAVERRLETVDKLRELAVELSNAERKGPVDSAKAKTAKKP